MSFFSSDFRGRYHHAECRYLLLKICSTSFDLTWTISAVLFRVTALDCHKLCERCVSRNWFFSLEMAVKGAFLKINTNIKYLEKFFLSLRFGPWGWSINQIVLGLDRYKRRRASCYAPLEWNSRLFQHSIYVIYETWIWNLKLFYIIFHLDLANKL